MPTGETIVRNIQAVDACGNLSAPYTQTVMEATDLEASASVTSVSCHGGQDAMGEVAIEGASLLTPSIGEDTIRTLWARALTPSR